jgi:hypothetical protein
MTDSLERFLHDLEFAVPAGLVDRAKATALDTPAVPRNPRVLIEKSRSLARPQPDVHIGRRTELAAGIAAAVIAAIAIGMFAYLRVATIPVAPTAPDPTIKQYQAMVGADRVAVMNFLQYQCTVNSPYSTACADAASAAIDPLQKWVDDLNQTRPPARFAAIDGRIRRHLTVTMAYLRDVIAANKAMDEAGATAAVAASQNERDTVNREANAVLLSSQETVSSYSGNVRSDNSKLLACDLCQALVSQSQATCQASQTPSCVDKIAAARVLVETFQDDLVRFYAPGSFAAKDRRLQADLLAADTALDAMESARSAGDQVGLEAGRGALLQALSRVNSDAADIARGV